MNTAELGKKVQQRVYVLRVLRKNNIAQKLLVSFYRCSIESILCYCFCVCFSNCTTAQRKTLQGIVKISQGIITCSLASLDKLHSSRCLRNAGNIMNDSSHPAHDLFQLLSGIGYRTIKTKTNRLNSSFYRVAVRILNGTWSPPVQPEKYTAVGDILCNKVLFMYWMTVLYLFFILFFCNYI